MPTMAPSWPRQLCCRKSTASPAPGSNRHCDPYSGIADHIAAHGDIAKVRTPAGAYSDLCGVLDHVPGHRGFRLDAYADAGILGSGVRSLRSDVADQVAMNGRKPSAVVEIGDGNSVFRSIDARCWQ